MLYMSIAYWISHRAIKLVYDINDGFRTLPEGTSIDVLKDTVYKFFNVNISLLSIGNHLSFFFLDQSEL